MHDHHHTWSTVELSEQIIEKTRCFQLTVYDSPCISPQIDMPCASTQDAMGFPIKGVDHAKHGR